MFDSHKHVTWAKLRVGIVITLGLAVIFFAILFAESIVRLFTPQATVYAEFSDVKGLRSGAPVWFSGVQIGSVKSLRFEKGEKITAALGIDKSALSYLKKDSVSSILTMGLLGDKYVEMSPGSREAPSLQPGDTISGSPRLEISEELKRVIEDVQTSKGSIARLLRDDTLYRDLSASMKDIKVFAAMLKSSEGTISKVIKDPALYDRFVKASKSLDSFSEKLATSRGTVNKLVEDASLYENMNAAAIRLNAILEKIDRGEGSVGKLITDRQVADELRSTLKEINALTKDIKEHPKKYFSFSLF
ncbi:MAG TPA: MlaD family protein [Nitrospirota bacterium]|nr:MlaD family protein [Nitrospirota bacterium]